MAASTKNRGGGKHKKDHANKNASATAAAAAAVAAPPEQTEQAEETKKEKKDASQFDLWTPTASTAFKHLMWARMCAAFWNIITDCDETFNYWEPTHYLVFGHGFQTWEYSPAYALRSYYYLWLHSLPLRFYRIFFGENKFVLFYLLRCLLGMICAGCEVYFYKGLVEYFGPHVSRLWLWFTLFGAGMFISSSAFLPSSFSMYLTMLAVGAWLQRKPHLSVMAIAASSIIGWPFAAILGVPIVVDILFRQRKLRVFVLWTIISLILFLLPLVQLDTHYYGRLVIAPLNIIKYNVFSQHGPDLYGVEPLSYYIFNGILNFNVLFPAALVALPLAYAVSFLIKSRDTPSIPLWLVLSPMYIWVLIFFTQPHKEERFLFPIFPLFTLAGAVTLDALQKAFHWFFGRRGNHYTDSSNWLALGVGAVFTLLSVSRIIALYQGYHASTDIYLELHRAANDPGIHTLPLDRSVTVCVGKEWHRFPSSFFLPRDNWHLQFLKSEFKGQLPGKYGTGPDAMRFIPPNMNDMNKEEESRYVSPTKCHYLVDLDTEQATELEPHFSHMPDWKVVSSVKFIDPARSHRLLRAFYVPFLSSYYCTYVDYNLLKSTRTKKSRMAASAR